MSERIKIEIDDAELDAFMLRLDMVLQKSRATFGTSDVKAGASASIGEVASLVWAFDQLEEAQRGVTGEGGFNILTDLSSVNREMRMILGQLPGMRQWIWHYFQIKRLFRGFAIGGPATILALVATTIALTQSLARVEQQMRSSIESYRQTFGEYFDTPDELNRFLTRQNLGIMGVPLDEWDAVEKRLSETAKEAARQEAYDVLQKFFGWSREESDW